MGIRDWVEEKVDRTRSKLQSKTERRQTDYRAKADINRGARDVENLKKYNRGDISESLYNKRTDRSEKRYERERLTPEERATRVTERIVTGSADAVAAFNRDLEYSATGRSPKKKKGRSKTSSRGRSSSGGGFGSVDFSQLGGFGGGGGGSLDFSSLNGAFRRR